MKPEDIDKIFKEGLGNSSPTPPADLWSRLQERMEPEQEKPIVLMVPESEQKNRGKQRNMWFYSSVAATLSLLLAVGVVFYNINTGTPEISETITKYDLKLPESQPTAAPILIDVPQTAPGESMMAQNGVAEENLSSQEKNLTPQATAEAKAASNITKQPATKKMLAEARPKALQQASRTNTAVEKETKSDAQTAIAANLTPEAPAAEAAPAKEPAGFAKANLNAEPVEIIIKRAVASQTAMPEEVQQTGRSSKKTLAKNIFKQVRNLASGETLELEELGIRADRVALETQIGKQKISKVINL
ncbi:hypothetical protein [uncultured Pontibacter sp.]|uniref:hypothetical protein n=1 Tax=uncultured Pontibacter sp. TaxID=453356 RepID=UPI002617A46F|nr:hypothetical protein [uncultured Pontibacter sp.]